MQNQLMLPGISCDKCGGGLVLYIETNWFSISSLKIKCIQCNWNEDILEKGNEKIESSKEYLKEVSQEIANTAVKLSDTLPKSKDEWGEVITNPKHPFTAALLSGLVILMMELSGFSVFMAVTWILGNLILNPVGWVLIPIIVAIAFAYRQYFSSEQLTNLKMELNELEMERDKGNLTAEEFQAAKDKLLAEYFK